MHQPDFAAKMRLEAAVSPSEDPLKVAGALANIAGVSAEAVTLGQNFAKLTTSDPESMVHLRDALRDRHIRSAARRQLLHNLRGRKATLLFNRQAAAAGVLAICSGPEESPLGAVYVVIESQSVDKAVDWLTAYEEG